MEQVESQVKGELLVDRKIGSLPRLWDRSAVFFANLLSLFFGNTRGTEMLRREVGTLESYGGRLIPIINLVFRGGDNLLLLEGRPDRALCRYFDDVLHLPLPEVETGIYHQDYLGLLGDEKAYSAATRKLVDLVRNHPAEWLDGFVTDEALAKLSALTGKKLVTSLEGSRQGNNKFLLHEFLSSCRLPVFDTCLAKDEAEVRSAMHELRQLGYERGVAKAQVGASGIGMLRLDFDEESLVPDYLFHEGPCLVQGWLAAAPGIEFVGSPSVQMFIGEQNLCLFDLTEQFLTPLSVHEGNMAPPTYLEEEPDLREELLRQGEIAARWLHERGYRGTASADCHVIKRRGAFEVRICEINARITGATYPSLLARFYHPHGAWLMRNVRFTRPYPGEVVLDALSHACLLFQPGIRSGILPINFNLTRDNCVGKGQFLAIGRDVAEVHGLFECVRNLESILWEYDRD